MCFDVLSNKIVFPYLMMAEVRYTICVLSNKIAFPSLRRNMFEDETHSIMIDGL